MTKHRSTSEPTKQSSIRINRFLAASGLCSRRKADEYVTAGRVSMNGQVVRVVGTLVDPTRDTVLVDGAPVTVQTHRVFALHKPVGTVSTMRDELGRGSIATLTQSLPRVFPVGRLDRSSEGLILLTNDGDLALRLTHPRYKHEKVYEVWTHRTHESIPRLIEKLGRAVVLDGRHRRFDAVRYLGHEKELLKFSVTLHEGVKHQVRRMFDRAGLTVLRLKRVQHGPILLGELPAGTWRELTVEEYQLLTAVKAKK